MLNGPWAATVTSLTLLLTLSRGYVVVCARFVRLAGGKLAIPVLEVAVEPRRFCRHPFNPAASSKRNRVHRRRFHSSAPISPHRPCIDTASSFRALCQRNMV